MRRILLITGSRRWRDPEPIRRAIDALPPGSMVVVGDATGADAIAYEYASTHPGRHTVARFHADWARYGRKAGPIRNQRMLDEGEPTEALACPLGASPGTRDMMRRLAAAGVPTTVVEGLR